MKVAVVGAGLTGSVIARLLAEMSVNVTIFEKDKIGGMCSDFFDKDGYMQRYGPHIFHTNNDEVFYFLSRFADFKTFDHKVIADTNKGFMQWPINIESIKQSFNENDEKFVISLLRAEVAKAISENSEIDNFESKALKLVGKTLYDNFIYFYTRRQWGREPSKLPSELINRIEVRFNSYDLFFADKYVCMPSKGYSEMLECILDNDKINIIYDEAKGYERLREFDFVFNTAFCSDIINDGCELETVNIKFDDAAPSEIYESYFQKGYSVINNCSAFGNFTRMTNMNSFYNFASLRTIAEVPSKDGYKLYPVRTKENIEKHKKMDLQLKNVFNGKIINCGRCGGYKYINMDKAVELAFGIVKEFKKC